jgi:hypothetical protein
MEISLQGATEFAGIVNGKMPGQVANRHEHRVFRMFDKRGGRCVTRAEPPDLCAILWAPLCVIARICERGPEIHVDSGLVIEIASPYISASCFPMYWRDAWPA